MKVLNWNTQADRLSVRTPRFERSRQLVTRHDADVICLTEAFPESMPEGGDTVTSDLSGWKKHENRGARKVVLWSRFGWTDVDRRGSQRLPDGRFVRATTTFEGTGLTVVGMCIPYRDYRTRERWWGSGTKRPWEGACEYLNALRDDILAQPRFRKRTILLGDFNLEIPPRDIRERKAWSIRNERLPFPDGPCQQPVTGTTLHWTRLSKTTSPFRRIFVHSHPSFLVVSTLTDPNRATTTAFASRLRFRDVC